MTLRTNWSDYAADKITASYLNQLGNEFNAVQANVTNLLAIASSDVSTTNSVILTNKTLSAAKITGGLLDANGLMGLDIGATASAANYLRMVNAAATAAPDITVAGVDANIGIDILPKGTGRVTVTNLSVTNPRVTGGVVDSNGNTILSLGPVGSAVNYLQIQNAATAATPGLYAAGADTNMDLLLRPKGTGRVLIGAAGVGFTSAAIAASNGSETDVNIVLTPKGAGRTIITTLNATSPRITTAINDSNGNPIVLLNPVGSAVNYIQILNAITANGPQIRATGTDTNVSMSLYAKGTGAFFFRDLTGSGNAFVVAPVANCVNYVQVNGAVTGSSPALVALGTDTNVSLLVQPKGTGSVQVRDGNGVSVVQFQGVTSAVNYWSVNNSAAGSSLQTSAQGTDTNINLVFATKGTGLFVVRNSDTSNGFVVNPVASSVNYVQVTSTVTGSGPQLQVTGTDTDVSMNLRTRGVGAIALRDGSNQPMAQFNTIASAVNYMNFFASVTGTGVLASATGTDTDINFEIRAKGAGAAILSGQTGLRIVRAVSVASAVNHLQITNSVTTASPIIEPIGTDTNIGLTVQAKGTGVVVLGTIIRHKTYATAGRPTAATAGQGGEYYDTTLSKPVYSDGTNWRDAAGTIV